MNYMLGEKHRGDMHSKKLLMIYLVNMVKNERIENILHKNLMNMRSLERDIWVK